MSFEFIATTEIYIF